MAGQTIEAAKEVRQSISACNRALANDASLTPCRGWHTLTAADGPDSRLQVMDCLVVGEMQRGRGSPPQQEGGPP